MESTWNLTAWRAALRNSVLAAGSVACALGANAISPPPPAILSNSSVQLAFIGGWQAPKLAWVSGASGFHFSIAAEEPLPASVEVNGASVSVAWHLNHQLSHADGRHVVFIYETASPHLRLQWLWEARAAFGPMEHFITIENLGGQEVWLPLVDSFRLEMICSPGRQLQNFYVEKGADAPSPQGTHQESVGEGYHWIGKSSTYARPVPGEAREIIPAEFVFNANQPQAGWFAGIEFSGRTRILLERRGNRVRTVLGLNPDPGPFRTRVMPGGSFTTPTVFFGAFTGGPDGAGNQLRPWVRAVLGNPLTWNDPQYPLTVNNSWGSGMQVDEKLALQMIDESKELGLEMFHLDAGWFRGVGDWYSDPKKFPHGLGFIADAAHKQGLRFGLWVDWTQAGTDTEPGALNVRDPKVRDWLVADVPANWKPEEFKGQTVDVGVPAARDYFAKELKRIVYDDHLDMLEHDGYLVAQGCTRDDHPHAAPDRSTMKITHDWGSDFVLASNSTDVSYHAVRAYYGIYEQTRREHPGLLFEICNDGGRMVDFGSAAHGDYFSITDVYDPLSNRRAFYDASHVLPAAMLESYVEKWPAPRPENFLYMLRSGMMGWVTLMADTAAWSAEQHETARQAIALYKSRLRPLIRDAQLFHISARPDGVHWDAMEYWDPAKENGVVYVFRGSVADEERHTVVLAGLDPSKRYALHFQDGTAPDTQATGSQLMEQGLNVHLALPLSSELVFFQEAGTARDE
ncbi:MAG: alpha-galactosidase [Terracidiphilus sp.]